MPPPGYEPFLRAICANPEDDTIRLVYADWLDENGDPDRAEFIRLQIACIDNTHPKNPALRRAERLRKANGGKWKAELPHLNDVDWGVFQRGFVSVATFKSSWLIYDSLATVVQAAPVRAIVLARCDPHSIHELARASHLGQIRALESRAGYAGDTSIAALANSPHARGLEVLTLPGTLWAGYWEVRQRVPIITDRAAHALTKSPYLLRLRKLTFTVAHISETGLGLLRARFGNGFRCGEVIPLPDTPPL